MFPLRRLLGLSAARIRCGRIPVRIPHGVDHRHTDHPRAVRPRRMRDAGTRPAGGTADDRRSPADARLLELERKYPGSRAFYAGTCHLCPEGTCARSEGRPCRYPDRIRPSLESLGFDIGKTASELLGIELKWSEPGSSGLPEYFTLVSGFFSSRPANDGSW